MAEKFVLMSSLEPLQKHDQFETWPLHVTVLPWFSLPPESERAFINALSNRMHDVAPMKITGDTDAFFGPNEDVHVRTLRGIGALASLHNMSFEMIVRHGGTVDSEYIRNHYVPHVTYQGEAGVDEDEPIQLDRMQLICGDTDGPRTVERVFSFLKGRQ